MHIPLELRSVPHPGASGEVMEVDSFMQTAIQESIRLLQNNLTPFGIAAAASTPESLLRSYTCIFARDAAICVLAMVLSGDDALQSGAKASLLTLSRHQASNGQIPNFVNAGTGEADFWYLGCIDATLWWLIAVNFYVNHLPDEHLDRELAQQIANAVVWLRCQEHPNLFLLQQNEASDWADIMPRSGFVLYTNALWYYVKTRYNLANGDQTKYHFNHLFFPFSTDVPDYRRLRLLRHFVRNKTKKNGLYLSFVNFSFWGDEGDVFGNLLAILFGLADDERSNDILYALESKRVNYPFPIRVTCSPIERADPLWRAYMARHQQNMRYQYHNGGIWPFVGGFWVLVLARAGRIAQARTELQRLAEVNSINNWSFNEWFHGQTGEPRGMAKQSWNGAMLLLAHEGLKRKIF